MIFQPISHCSNSNEFPLKTNGKSCTQDYKFDQKVLYNAGSSLNSQLQFRSNFSEISPVVCNRHQFHLYPSERAKHEKLNMYSRTTTVNFHLKAVGLTDICGGAPLKTLLLARNRNKSAKISPSPEFRSANRK